VNERIDLSLKKTAIRPPGARHEAFTSDGRAKAPVAGARELLYKPNAVEDLNKAVARPVQTVREKSKSY
jgi:hypothetical protein